MSPLAQAVSSALGPTGALFEVDERYTERQAQQRMALAVTQAIDDVHTLVVEAGTGVGKTFAYLVPTLLSGKRALISTATKSLQDQLYGRDLPRLKAALKTPVNVALLKGRSSYLCLHRLSQATQLHDGADPFVTRDLAQVQQWAQSTVSGDLAEVTGLNERSKAMALITSSRENCLGSDCPVYRQCHVMKARREALAADVVVINHYLFFADMALREGQFGELLPQMDVVIFDEAHQLTQAGVHFLGTRLGSSQLIDFARDLLLCGLQHARGLQPWPQLAADCETAGRELSLVAGRASELRANSKLGWAHGEHNTALMQALQAVTQACQRAQASASAVAETSADFSRLAERSSELAALAKLFTQPVTPGQVRWMELTAHQVRLVESPLDLRKALGEQMRASPKTWVFTSATLGDNEALSWFTESTGLEDAQTLRVGSPFDYPNRAKLYIPARFPKPSEANHPQAVAGLAAQCARALGGRTFVLTTTLRALQTIATQLQDLFQAGQDHIDVLLQGRSPKRQLLAQFLAQPRSVLVGSQSFWEGIDVPGEALQCVLIDKLPFPPPNDPLVQAHVQRLEQEGRNPFNDYFLAEAAVALKQGAGRLIRSETDHGLLVICDPRMAQMRYGRRLCEALPPMGRIHEEAQALAWLRAWQP